MTWHSLRPQSYPTKSGSISFTRQSRLTLKDTTDRSDVLDLCFTPEMRSFFHITGKFGNMVTNNATVQTKLKNSDVVTAYRLTLLYSQYLHLTHGKYLEWPLQ